MGGGGCGAFFARIPWWFRRFFCCLKRRFVCKAFFFVRVVMGWVMAMSESSTRGDGCCNDIIEDDVGFMNCGSLRELAAKLTMYSMPPSDGWHVFTQGFS
jgi:hypothetical protein